MRLGVAASWGFALLVGGGCFLGDSLPAIHDIEVPRTLDRIVADQRESQPVLLEFAHGAWPRAISLALALERRGLPWLVSDDWGFVFGHEHRASRHQGRAPEAWVVTREDVSAGGRSYRFE